MWLLGAQIRILERKIEIVAILDAEGPLIHFRSRFFSAAVGIVRQTAFGADRDV